MRGHKPEFTHPNARWVTVIPKLFRRINKIPTGIFFINPNISFKLKRIRIKMQVTSANN
jgi:hypothetical protein